MSLTALKHRCRGVLTLCAALMLAAPFAQAEEPLPVELFTTTLSTQTLTFSLTGEVVARDTLRASFPSGGRIAQMQVEEGDHVASGAVLAQMDSVQQAQALRAAQAGLSTAQANHTQAIEDLDRQDTLLERGATTRISRDSAEDALRIAEGALTQANADLDRAQRALDDATLTAPTNATVIKRLAEPGQVVGAAQPVLELALGRQIDGPAVWVVDPDTMAVSLRSITVERYETGWIILSGGLEENEQVVTRGAQLLYPGRIVRAAGESQ